MAEPFVGEIRIVSFDFAPVGWALCNGQILSIAQNTALFSLLGTFYGGDGKSTFALPNLQGCAPMDQGSGSGLTNRIIGETGGEATVTLTTAEIPAHQHTVSATTAASYIKPGPADSFGTGGKGKAAGYGLPSGSPVTLNAQAVTNTGGGQPHNNLPPYLTLNFIIAMQGVYPPRS